MAYVALVGIFVLVVLATDVWPRGRRMQEYGPNFTAEFAGILIVLVFVERIVAWQREQERLEIRIVALRRVERALNRFLRLLRGMYVATMPEGSETYESVAPFLEAWWRAVPNLSFTAPAEPGSSESWAHYAARSLNEIERDLLACVDRYGDLIGGRLVVAIEDVVSSFLFRMLHDFCEREVIDAAEVQRDAFYSLGGYQYFPPELRQKTLAEINRVFEVWGEVTQEPVTLEPELWTIYAGEWGVARYSGDVEPASPA